MLQTGNSYLGNQAGVVGGVWQLAEDRSLMVQIFAFAAAKELAERNVAELTLAKKEQEKVRQIHTAMGIKNILEYVGTPDWLRRATHLTKELAKTCDGSQAY